MPKIGIKPVRKKQLIDATLASISEFGLHKTTIMTISKIAGLSSGIISHYFGGKQELVYSTVKHLLEQLKIALLERIKEKELTPVERLYMIVEANFTPFQRSVVATKTWVSFWAQSMHEPDLARLQYINSRRLHSNLLYSFRQLMTDEMADISSKQMAAMIDGFWLRSALSAEPEIEFQHAERLCKKCIDDLINQHGDLLCH